MSSKNTQFSKRVLVDKTKAIMLGVLIGSSVITVFALVASNALFNQAGYLNRVAAEKEKAVNQLKANDAAVSTLVASYKKFSEQNPNLIGGTATGTGERDGDNARLVLDALPSKYDFPALATSLEKLLTGYSINNITGSDDNLAQETATGSATVEMPFKLSISSDYKGMQTLFNTIEKSIRPFQVTKVEFTGTNGTLQGTIDAKTFYQPEKDLNITTKVIK